MNRPTSSGTKTSVTVSPRVSEQRTKEATQKRNTTPQVVGSPQTNINLRIGPQMPVGPRLGHHRGTRGLSSTVSLESFLTVLIISKIIPQIIIPMITTVPKISPGAP
jgi:hypothetical protein